MTLTTQPSVQLLTDTSSVVFLPTHVNSQVATGYVCFPVVFWVNDKVERMIHPAKVNGANVQERMRRLEGNSARSAALASARARLGKWVGDEFPGSKGLASLRLKAGLSQTALAERMNTQQSNISRWEKVPGDMQYSSIKNLARALNVSTDEVLQAIDAANNSQGEVA